MSESAAVVILGACCVGIAGGAYVASDNFNGKSGMTCNKVVSETGYNSHIKELARLDAIGRWVKKLPPDLAKQGSWHSAMRKNVKCLRATSSFGYVCVASARVCVEQRVTLNTENKTPPG